MFKTSPLVRKNNLVIQEFENEVLIYDLKTNKVFGLNQTLSLVWQLSTGDKTISEIAGIMSEKLDSKVGEDFVWLALTQLKKEKLIENDEAISSIFDGTTRREVIKKIGFGSLIALPVISSVIAPAAVQAQSSGNCGTSPNIALGCSCVVGGLANSSNCASMCCNFIQAGLPGICITAMTLSYGSPCVRGCQCPDPCCSNGVCATTGKSFGSPCLNSCECSSNACGGGMCVN